MKLRNLLLALLLLGVSMLHAQTVSDVSFAPRHPWNGLVDITFQLSGEPTYSKLQIVSTPVYQDYSVVFFGYDQDRDKTVPLQAITGQTADFANAGTYTVTWNAAEDFPEFAAKDFRLQAQLLQKQAVPSGDPNSTYLVIDLSGGSTATSYPCRYTNTAPDLSGDACRTTELWLRRIPAGTFLMGSPEDELGRSSYFDETQHEVTLTQDYYVGVFEVTQRQYELVTGSNPSYYQGGTRPVEYVSYDDLRGTSAEGGAGWPEQGHAVDAGSFFGVLRAKTGLLLDLPTEAQWEYACRAGTTTALNSGKNLTATDTCPNLAEVGRYYNDKSDGKGGYSQHTRVGSYLPNAWGLYDMHGNVEEWCLDWFSSYGTAAVTDPAGSPTGSYRVLRGGSWVSGSARGCRSARRDYDNPSDRDYGGGFSDYGFRVVCLP